MARRGARTRTQSAKKLDLLAEREIRRCRADCAHFVRRYVCIEDKDLALAPTPGGEAEDPGDSGEEAPGVLTRFSLWPAQAQALQAMVDQRLLVVLKARQLGITWLAVSYTVWRMLFFPGFTAAGVSRSEEEAKELTRRVTVVLRHLPPWMVVERTPAAKKALMAYAGVSWESSTMTVTLHHPGGAGQSVFHAFTSSPSAGRSFTQNLVLLDEWAYQQWAEDIWAGIFPTVNRPSGGQVIGLSTNKRGSFFERIVRTPDEYGFTRLFLPWAVDPRRTQTWYECAKKALPHSWRQEYPATVEDALSAGEDTAFPEFSEAIHVCDDFTPPEHWRRWRALDNGYADPFAWYWFAVSEDGTVYIYREYTRTPGQDKVVYSDQAREAARLSTYTATLDGQAVEVQERFLFTAAGTDAWATHHRDQAGKTLVDYYEEGGIGDLVKAVTDRRLRKAVWHEYLKPYMDDVAGRLVARVQICRSCRQLIETLPQLVKDENDAEKVAECAIDHWYDSAGYGLVAHHIRQSSPVVEELTGDAKRIHDHIESLARERKHRIGRRTVWR